MEEIKNCHPDNISVILKYPIYRNLIVTSENKDIANSVSEFIMRIVGYKPKPGFIKEIDSELNFLCPILNVFKAMLHLDYHSFQMHEGVSYYLNIAKKQKSEMKEKYGHELESWENNWINLIEHIVNKSFSKIYEVLFQNAKENPHDMLAFKVGMVMGLYSGDKEFLKSYAELFHKHEENHCDGNFIGVYSFIKEECREFEESEKWVSKGMEIAPNNIWIQHVLAHIMYQTDRVDESIQFLESKKYMWEENASNFVYKHINWHLAIGYLEQGDYEKSNKILEEIISKPFEESECVLAILGYIIRVYIRSNGNLQEASYNKKWNQLIFDYLKNLKIYTHHLLFDALAIWFLTYFSKQNEQINELLSSVLKQIEENVESQHISNDHREYYKNYYLKILKAMKSFGDEDYKDTVDLLKGCESAIWRIGASDEQLFVLFEVELYSSYKSKDKENFDRMIKDIFGEQMGKLAYVKKFQKNLSA
jgi:hypothetical protein